MNSSYIKSISRAWIEVDLDAIIHNMYLVRRVQQGTAIMPIVKAEAYGHGLVAISKLLDREDIAFLGVANVLEAKKIHDAGVLTKPFILGATFPGEREEIVKNDWRCIISTLEDLSDFEQISKKYGKIFNVHLAVDTGMGREGFAPHELGNALNKLNHSTNIKLEGIMTHCPAADVDIQYTENEIRLFEKCVKLVECHHTLKYKSIASSACALGYKLQCSNLVRLGLLTYGIPPIDSDLCNELRPTLFFFARVLTVRELQAGSTISYGCTYKVSKNMRVATLGVGYACGWSRHLSQSPAKVYINGHYCSLLGRVTMDQIVVDVTHLPCVKSGDIAELIGKHITVNQLAEWAGTIGCEIYARLGSRVPRIYKSNTPQVINTRSV